MNAQPKRQPAVINPNLVVGDLEFTTPLDRCRYLGTSIQDRLRWLEEHPGSWRRIEGDQRKAASPAPPSESEIKVGTAPAGPNDQTSSRDVRKDGDDDAVALVDTLGGDRSPPHPTLLPTPVTATLANGTTKAEPLRGAEPAVSEATGSKTETSPLGAKGRKQGRSSGRKLKKQKLPAEISKVGRKRTARMLLFLDRLAECRILSEAARKAGIRVPQSLLLEAHRPARLFANSNSA